MPSCVMRFCHNYTTKTTKTQGITYHTFPLDELRRIEWVDIVRKQRNEEDWQPNSSSKICSIHFKDEDKYTSSKGYTLVKKTAIPLLKVTKSSQSPLASPSSLAEEKISDLESVFDTPRKAALKEHVRKINIEKQNMINKNRNLKKQNQRLKKKLVSMSGIIKHLKNRLYIYQMNNSMNSI